jgi:hypothetical protein
MPPFGVPSFEKQGEASGSWPKKGEYLIMTNLECPLEVLGLSDLKYSGPCNCVQENV